MEDTPVVRSAMILVLVGSLVGLFVLYGAGVGHPDPPPYGEDELLASGGDLAGDPVELSGTVVNVDPVVIEIVDDDGHVHEVELENAPDAEIGEELLVVGTVQPDGTVVVERDPAVVREPWERQYMYAISVVGALLVAGRIVNEWRFVPPRLVFEPRDRTLYDRGVREQGDHDG